MREPAVEPPAAEAESSPPPPAAAEAESSPPPPAPQAEEPAPELEVEELKSSPPVEVPEKPEKSAEAEAAGSSGTKQVLGKVPYGHMTIPNIVNMFPNRRTQQSDAKAILSALRASGKMWASENDQLMDTATRTPVEGTNFTSMIANLVFPGPNWYDPSQAATKSMNDLLKALKSEGPNFDPKVIRNEKAQHIWQGLGRETRKDVKKAMGKAPYGTGRVKRANRDRSGDWSGLESIASEDWLCQPPTTKRSRLLQ